jgi:hypothetical protein
MSRETSRVSFLMCPFCVRALISLEGTRLLRGTGCRSTLSSKGRYAPETVL